LPGNRRFSPAPGAQKRPNVRIKGNQGFINPPASPYNHAINVRSTSMKPAKLAVITLFALMAIGGISGVMLAGYSFIVRGGVG